MDLAPASRRRIAIMRDVLPRTTESSTSRIRLPLISGPMSESLFVSALSRCSWRPRIKVRGIAQTIFRKALLKAYGSKCAFCGLSFSFALQAAHIIPWSKATNSQRLDVRNGLLLCATHHCLYDTGILTVSRNYSINFVANSKHRLVTQYDNLLSSAFHNQKIKLPKKNQHLPNPEYLDFRNSINT